MVVTLSIIASAIRTHSIFFMLLVHAFRFLYFDTSFGYGTKPRDEALRIIEKHGTDKLLFGSDCPWHSPSMEKRLLLTLELSEGELSDIFWNNAMKLLK